MDEVVCHHCGHDHLRRFLYCTTCGVKTKEADDAPPVPRAYVTE